MAASRLFLLTLASTLCTLQLVASEVATYTSYSITSDIVCNRYHKRELQLHLHNPIILEGRNLSSIAAQRAVECKYEMEYKGHYRGVIGVVQKMNFRHSGDMCLDYIQTIYHDRKSGIKLKHKKHDKVKKIYKVAKKVTKGHSIRKRDDDDEYDRSSRLCGDVLFGLHVDQNGTLPPSFVAPLPPTIQQGLFFGDENPFVTLTSEAAEVDPKGELKMQLYISNRMLRVGESLDISVVYTAYKVCNGNSVPENLFHCGYGVCISRLLVHDGIVNCPFGDCIDEESCTHAKNANITAKVIVYRPSGESTAGEVSIKSTLICLAVLAVICGAIYYIVVKRKQTKGKTYAVDAEEEEAQEMQGGFQDPDKAANNPAPPPGYPQGPPMYPQGQPGYPPPQGQPMYPQGQPGYPPPQGQPVYPQGQPGYPPSQGQPMYPQGQPGYPPPQGQPGYPQGQPMYPSVQPGYPPPQGQPMYPPPQGEGGYPQVAATTTGPLQGVPPPLPEGGTIGFAMPPANPGAYPGQGGPAPPTGQTSAPSAPTL